METLTGNKPSPSTVSRVFHSLQAEFDAWKKRALEAHYAYVFADGTSLTVISEDEGQKTPNSGGGGHHAQRGTGGLGLHDWGARELRRLGRPAR